MKLLLRYLIIKHLCRAYRDYLGIGNSILPIADEVWNWICGNHGRS